jgi:hypothetical protein
MSLDSIVSTRLFLWSAACEAWDFEIDPPFTAETPGERVPGEVLFRAARSAVIDGESMEVSLTVAESWVESEHPGRDRRLEAEGCHLVAMSWHVQVGDDTGDRGAERFDVGEEDLVHPRIHRHPFGETNDRREPAELPPPDAGLHHVNDVLSGALDDGLQDWGALADEEE